MDRTAEYRQYVHRVLLADAAAHPPGPPDVQAIVVADDAQGRYLLLYVGWTDLNRAHDVVLHLHVAHGQVRVEEDGTDEGISDALVAAGVAADAIVLAWQPRSELRAAA